MSTTNTMQAEVKSQRFSQAKEGGLKNFLSKFGSVLALVLLCIVFTGIAQEKFCSVRNFSNILYQSSINSLLSVGMLLTLLTAGIDLSVGSVLALSTCVMGIAVKNYGVPPVMAMGLCVISGLFLGLCNGLMLTKLRLPHPFISTLGMKNIARGLALIITAATPISGFPQSIQIFSKFIGPVPLSAVLVLLVFVGFHIFLNQTASGRYIYAVGGNREAARLSGINVDRTLCLVYMLCGGMAAVGGLVQTARVNSAFPLAGLDFDLDAIAACIIGGASFMGGSGSVWGTLIGALIMAVLRNGLNIVGVSPDYQTLAIGAVIILAVYVDVLRRRAEQKAKMKVAESAKFKAEAKA